MNSFLERNRLSIGFVLLALTLAGCSHYHVPLDEPSVNLTALESEVSQKAEPKANLAVAVEIEEPTGPLTLRDALSLTLLHNPELKAYSYSIRAAEARHLQAGLWPNPELGIDVEDFGGSGDLSGFDGAETTIQLSQLFDLSGKNEKLQKVTSFDTKLAKSDYHMKRLDISMAVTKSFVELLFLQEKQQLSQNLIDVSEAVMESINKRVELGVDSPLDLLKAKVGLQKAIIYHDEINQQIESIRIQLVSYWSGKTPKFSRAAGLLNEINTIPEIARLQELIQTNPEITRWAFEIQKRDAELEAAKAKSVPDLTLSGGVKHFNFDNETAFVFGLSIPLPITSRNQGGRLEAIHNLSRAKHQEEAIIQHTWSQLHQLYSQLEATYKKATVLRNSVLSISEELFNASKVSYEEGKIGYLELLDAQRSYFTTQDEYIDVLAKYHVCKTELERLIGQPLEINDASN